ncbi:DUF5804 family protein [Methanogenium organophilum]|uniref:DUF5804 family protein n=1 Tax=Methanogenium organophilum TaxID=2199 RepID=A0A9X9S3V9_METOG|nr:DUF5804 family protein [Methanogenium organophilum]WAI01020.1 DUF5804 family protein [Methanogenium organophilum]
MKVLLIQKEGVDLHSTLLASETSREVLRFYHPKKTDWGVCIEASTLGSALSVVSELKWYIQRYVSQPLCLLSNGIICTPAYAGIIYEREGSVHDSWDLEILYGIKYHTVMDRIVVTPDSAINDISEFSSDMDRTFRARCLIDDLEKMK